MRLYLPESCLGDTDRLDKTGVPAAERRSVTKPAIALELLDRARAEGLPGRVVVADAGYGVSGDFRDGLNQRRLSYSRRDRRLRRVSRAAAVGAAASGPNGRPQTRSRLAPGHPRPVAVSELAARIPRQRVTWREGTQGKLSGHFAWVRVWPATGWQQGQCADAEPIWVLIEEQAGGILNYAFTYLPVGTSRLTAVRLWKSRWPVEQGYQQLKEELDLSKSELVPLALVEQGYQQLKEELGLDHFEGRSWRGFHHHAAMTIVAYGYLLLERHRATQNRLRRLKKGVRTGPIRCSRCRASGGRCNTC